MPRYSLTRRVALAKQYGLRVEIVPGAETRGSATYNPGCYIGHHTAGPKTGDRPSLKIVTDGRSDLEGPLANDFMPRMGGLVVVATGRSNNAGLGGFRGILGNSGTMACEAEDDGDGTWEAVQLRDYPRIVASGLALMDRDASWYASHRTWALTPPSYKGRKIDPTGIEDAWMQAQVTALLRAGGAGEDEDMPLNADDKAWLTTEIHRVVLRCVMAGLTGQSNTVISGSEAAGVAPVSVRAQVGGISALLVESKARELAQTAVLEAMAKSTGAATDVAALQKVVSQAVTQGLADLDLHLVAGDPTGPASQL